MTQHGPAICYNAAMRGKAGYAIDKMKIAARAIVMFFVAALAYLPAEDG